MRWFRGLKAQILLWTAVPVTLVLIGIAFTGVYSHEQAMRTLVEDRDRAVADASAAQVRELLLQWEATLERLSAQSALREQDADARDRLLAEAARQDGRFAGELVLIDEGGKLIPPGRGMPAWMGADVEPASRALSDLARAVTIRQGVAARPVTGTEGQDLILVGVPVYDARGAEYGVLLGPVAVGSLGLEPLLSLAQIGEHGVAYLLDISGRIIAHSQSPHARSSLAGHSGVATALQATQPGSTLCQAADGERMMLAYAGVGLGTDWILLIEQPWHEVVSPVLRYSQAMPLVAALAAVVALLALYYGVHSLVRPLRALGQQAEQVAWGDFQATRTPVGGVEEIEDLRRSLDQMARRIQTYQRGMHDYIAAMTRGQEDERRRLARELHDDTAQALIALGQQVEMAQKLLPTDPARAGERLAAVRGLLADTVEGVRRFSRNLRPVYLEDLGFLPALQMLAREAQDRESLSVHFSTIGEARRLPPELELAAYRIVQEALNNVIQHAHATQAWVEVVFDPNQLVLGIRDDGRGFEAPDQPDLLAAQGHFGLMGIQERALLYGGRLTLRSSPGRGVRLTVHLPIPPLDEPRQMAGD